MKDTQGNNGAEKINYIDSDRTEIVNFVNHLDPAEELKFFLREYKKNNKEKQEFYYIIPNDWFRKWENFILNPRYELKLTFSKENYPPKIDSSGLIDENNVIKKDLVENSDFVILPKSIAYYFHNTYRGNKRLKSKFRHIYNECMEYEENCILIIQIVCNLCSSIKNTSEVFNMEKILEENEELSSERRSERKKKCHIFSWC